MADRRDPDHDPDGSDESVATSSDDEAFRRRGIRCPKCKYRPRREDRWSCTCWHAWNTFDTAGRCPACGTQWLDTQCLACGAWSKHTEWYEP